jgi:hypothetical protein
LAQVCFFYCAQWYASERKSKSEPAAMKLLSSIVLLISVALAVCAQSEVTTRESSGLEVIKFSWSKERLGWERDPFGGPVENFDEMRSRTRNEKRLDDAKRGGSSAGADQVRREAKADAANLARQRQNSPSRYVFVYKTKVRNNGTTAITAIDWDYIFFERGTEIELGRQQFTSDEQIGPGKTKELTVTISSPPTHTVSVTSLNLNDEHKRLTEKIVLIRVRYEDGKVWQTP